MTRHRQPRKLNVQGRQQFRGHRQGPARNTDVLRVTCWVPNPATGSWAEAVTTTIIADGEQEQGMTLRDMAERVRLRPPDAPPQMFVTYHLTSIANYNPANAKRNVRQAMLNADYDVEQNMAICFYYTHRMLETLRQGGTYIMPSECPFSADRLRDVFEQVARAAPFNGHTVIGRAPGGKVVILNHTGEVEVSDVSSV